MPPRYTYWTIIADGLPTAFRAAERDELLPTLARIKHKHPDAEMKWFARGRLWDSPESARSANSPPSGPPERSRPAGPRGRDWRPGGEHRDPRQKYRDAKTARNVEERKRKFDRRQRFDSKGKPGSARPTPDRPSGPSGARDPRDFPKKFFPRNQGSDERTPPPRPAGPSREPRPQRFESKGKPAFPRPKPDRPSGPGGARDPRGFQKKFFPRNQGSDERTPPAGPSREPRPQRFESKGKPAFPRPKPDRSSGPGGARDPRGFQKKFFPRNQGSDERTPPRPAGPSREPRPQRFESKGKPAFPRPKPDRPSGPGGARDPRGFQKKFFPRNQGSDERTPPRPAGPSREPRPREGNRPTPPPRPSEPVIAPPGPPERGRRDPRRDTGKRRPR